MTATIGRQPIAGPPSDTEVVALSGPWPTDAPERLRGTLETQRMSRRSLLARVAGIGTAAGLASLGIFPQARKALAEGYDIYASCPSYAADHNCSPGCGPSRVQSNACLNGYHRNDGVTFKLRPNQCVSGTGWDGWEWAYTGTCACCQRGVRWRCHDGYTLLSGVWTNTICRYMMSCNTPAC